MVFFFAIPQQQTPTAKMLHRHPTLSSWLTMMVAFSLVIMAKSSFVELDSKTLLAPFQEYSVSDFNVISLSNFNGLYGDVQGNDLVRVVDLTTKLIPWFYRKVVCGE